MMNPLPGPGNPKNMNSPTRHRPSRCRDRSTSRHLPARIFCSDHDLAYGTFAKWRQRFAKPAQKKAEPSRLIELIQPASSQPGSEYWHVELELGNGMTLRLRTARYFSLKPVCLSL